MLYLNGDGTVDVADDNKIVPPATTPFDAEQLIKAVEPLPSTKVPLPYKNLDATTFYGVKGDAEVTFRVRAKNDVIKPSSLLVVRAELRVQTPKGIVLGGKDGAPHDYTLLAPGAAPRQLKSKEINVPIPTGSTIHVLSGGGGGWGEA